MKKWIAVCFPLLSVLLHSGILAPWRGSPTTLRFAGPVFCFADHWIATISFRSERGLMLTFPVLEVFYCALA